jgi:hypothetical protein
MTFGSGTYGQNPYGGYGYDGIGPYLKSSVPVNLATKVARFNTIVLVLSSLSGIDVAKLDVTINGTQAIVGGVFQPLFAGTIEADVEDCSVTITSHPLFEIGSNTVTIAVTDGAILSATPSITFDASIVDVDPAETVTLAETIQILQSQGQTISETVGLVDLASVVAGFPLNLTETVTQSEHLDYSYGTQVTGTETISLSEGASAIQGTAAALTETLTISDTFAQQQGFTIPKSELVLLTEGLATKQNFDTSLSETLTASESIDIAWGYGVPIDETVSLVETSGILFDGIIQPLESLTSVENFAACQPFAVSPSESVSLTEGTPTGSDVTVHETVTLLESISIGTEIHDAGYNVIVKYPPGLSLDNLLDLGGYRFTTEEAYPLVVEAAVPLTTPVMTGTDGSCVPVVGQAFSRQFHIAGQVPTTANIGDYLQFTTIVNGTVCTRITGVPAPNYLEVDTPFVGNDVTNIAWAILRVEGVQLRTTKPTNGGLYWLHMSGVYRKDGSAFVGISEFTGASSLPKLTSVEPLEGGQLVLTFSETMRFDSSFTDPAEYTLIGPGDAKVTGTRVLSSTQLMLFTLGLEDGNYALEVNATGTPKDIAGNPIDPTFNLAAFTAATPLYLRSVYTDKGPIAKPPISLQNGVSASVASSTEVTLPGATLSPSVVGKYLTLSGTINAGTYRVLGVVTATKARLEASFTYPDPGSGSITWDLFDPRNGQIADDPSDVTVTVNSLPVTPQAVLGLLGQIVLNSRPVPTDDVKVGYSWVCNPTVEVRRLNSQEFRLNNWNRDVGRPNDASMHKYRFNNILTTPALYVPDDNQAWLGQPQQRDLKYRAYERAYSALLNDPNLLLLNSPTQKIAFPPLSRSIASTFVNYDALVLPENDAIAPWIRKGTGSASVSGGRLLVQDTFVGEPVFWVRPLDITFPCVFASTWRMRISADPVTEGVFTGVATGYSGGTKVLLLGYLDDGGVKKLGFLKKGCGNDLQLITSWVGGVSTDAPIAWDWSIEHSYRLYKNIAGVTKLYVDGGVVEVLSVTEDALPYLEEVNAPFSELEGTFFGSLSRPATNTSYWSFVRYTILPTNPYQIAPSEFVSYEGTTSPEEASQPWTPVGYHGTETIINGDYLLLDSTSATDDVTESSVGLIGGDFKGFIRLEPLLSAAAEVVLDLDVQLRTFTHGITPNAVTAAIDDGDRLIQLSFFPKESSPKFSYGGRTLPENWTPVPWSSSGTAPVAMLGRTLRITDTSITDGRIYLVEDAVSEFDPTRVVSTSTDYVIEFRAKVQSYNADPGGFCGATADIYDSTRTLGILLEEVGGVKSVALHSDGIALLAGRFLFDWNDGKFHTYRLTKRAAMPQPIVSLFIDGVYALSVDYSLFVVPPVSPVGVVSFGSATTSSSLARSVVDWAYCNCWRIQETPRTFVGIWKGYDANELTGYHLPLKAFGQSASVGGNAMNDPLADFPSALVLPGDSLVVDVGPNKGTYEIAALVGSQTLTIVGSFPSAPSTLSYRVIREIDWSLEHKYRLVKDPGGGVSLLLDAEVDPIILLGYNNLDLPASSSGIFKGIAGGLPSISFGAFDPTNVSQTAWDFVRFGITRSVSELRAVPHHQILNQRNVMASPEHLRTAIPHNHTDYWASSTGIPSQVDPDFLQSSGLVAFTLLNEGTPLVPLTQTSETRAGHDLRPIQEPLSGLNRPEDVLGSQSFTLNDAETQWKLHIPDDVLYNSLAVIESKTGATDLLTPFCDGVGPQFGPIYYQNEVCLWYDGDVLPELDPTAPTPWVFEADDDSHVNRSAFAGVLTFGTDATGTKTVYRNATPLPDSAGLETEARFRLKLLSDGSGGLGDTQVRFGLSAPGMTLGLAFVTTSLGERYVLVRDLQAGIVVGGAPFDFGDGNFHTYRIVKDIRTASVRIYLDA